MKKIAFYIFKIVIRLIFDKNLIDHVLILVEEQLNSNNSSEEKWKIVKEGTIKKAKEIGSSVSSSELNLLIELVLAFIKEKV